MCHHILSARIVKSDLVGHWNRDFVEVESAWTKVLTHGVAYDVPFDLYLRDDDNRLAVIRRWPISS